MLKNYSFLKNVLLCSLIIVVIVECWVSSSIALGWSNDKFGDWNFRENKIDADVLFVGPSTTFVHVDAAEIERRTCRNIYCISENGSPMSIHYLKIVEYLKYNKGPKLVLLDMNPDGLVEYDSMAIRGDHIRHLFLSPRLSQVKSLLNYYKKHHAIDWKYEFLPLSRYSGHLDVLLNHCILSKRNTRKKGSELQDLQWQYTKLPKNAVKFKNDFAFVDSFIYLSRKHKFNILFRYPEMTKNKFDLYKPNLNQIVRYLSNRGENITINDKQNSIEYSDSLRYFYNHTHLNKIGVKIIATPFLSHLINSEIR